MTEYIITVKPGSSQERLVSTGGNTYTAYLRAKPHDGEANVALVKLLSRHFRVGKTSISIIRGAKSRTKTIQIQ